MMKLITNGIKIPELFFFIWKTYKNQRAVLKKTVESTLIPYRERTDSSLKKVDFDKIQFYYGVNVAAIGAVFSILRDKALSYDEQKTLSYLGATTGLFDDLFDKLNVPHQHIQLLLNEPKLSHAKNDHEQLLVELYQKALDHGNRKRMAIYAQEVFEAQKESLKQERSDLNFYEIKEITRLKGVSSLLFYRSSIDGEIKNEEETLIRALGYIGQLENDLFDIYKDREANLATLATQTSSITLLETEYKSAVDNVYQQLSRYPCKKKNKLKFSYLFAAITSRGFVCIDQLKTLEQGNSFKIDTYSRKQLICDMGKPLNMLKWMHYYLNWNRS